MSYQQDTRQRALTGVVAGGGDPVQVGRHETAPVLSMRAADKTEQCNEAFDVGRELRGRLGLAPGDGEEAAVDAIHQAYPQLVPAEHPAWKDIGPAERRFVVIRGFGLAMIANWGVPRELSNHGDRETYTRESAAYFDEVMGCVFVAEAFALGFLGREKSWWKL